jgi:repressor LexA
MVTPIQQRVYEFIKKFIAKKGHSPSLTEIAAGIGISAKSKSLISRCVHALHEHNLIDLAEGHYRQIQLKNPSPLAIPLIGRIAAGNPIEAIEEQETLDMAEIFGKNKRDEVFALKVKGDSMIDEGIFDGDMVLCKKADTADKGAIVVALIDSNEATLKRIYYMDNSKIKLCPANPALKPKIYDAHRVTIQGICIGLLRLN